MTEQEVLKIVQEIVCYVTGVEVLTMDTDFAKDLALNSLDVANLVSAFEDKFYTKIPITEVWKLTQVKDVVRYLMKTS